MTQNLEGYCCHICLMRVTVTYSPIQAGIAVIVPNSNRLDLPPQSTGIDQWIVWKRHAPSDLINTATNVNGQL